MPLPPTDLYIQVPWNIYGYYEIEDNYRADINKDNENSSLQKVNTLSGPRPLSSFIAYYKVT